MDNRIIDALTTIRDMYGDGIFYNHTKTKNLLHDLSPELRKERIQVTNFLEMNGYFQLKYAGRSYYIIRNRLITHYANTYAVSENTAAWVVDVFGALLGYNDIRSGAQYYREQPASSDRESDATTEIGTSTGINPETRTRSERRSGKNTHAASKPEPLSYEPLFDFSTAYTPYDANTALPLDGGVTIDRSGRDADYTSASGDYTSTVPGYASTIPGYASTVPESVGLREGVDYTARISADFHSVAVSSNGQVLSAGLNEDGQCNTFPWRNMTAVSAGTYYTIGLRANGTVTAVGRNDYGQCNVRLWTDIAAISAGPRHTVGLRTDGSVVATGQNKSGECNVQNWRNIIRVIAGYQCTFGIKKDRRVLVKGNNKAGDLTVSHLNGVVDIANAATGRAVALLCDGRVVRIGREDYMQRDFSKWRDIRQISAGPDYIAGLCEDGTVKLLAYFWEDSGIECSLDDWREVAYIAAGRYHLMGLRRDGTLLAAMLHPDYSHNRGQCDVRHWRVR